MTMAEFCLECFQRFVDENVTRKDVILMRDFCEECACIKPCVLMLKKRYMRKIAEKEGYPLSKSSFFDLRKKR